MPIRRQFLLLLVAWSAYGCVPSHLPPTPMRPQDDPYLIIEKDEPVKGLAHSEAEPLVVLPGDSLSIEVVSTATSLLQAVVDSTGNVHVPLGGDVRVAGLGLGGAEEAIQRVLLPFDKLVQVNVLMASSGGHRVTVTGAVAAPGVVPLKPAMRVSDVLLATGGPRERMVEGFAVQSADLGAGTLMRNGEPLPIDMEKALLGDAQHNVHVHTGDHLHLPAVRGRNISVMGQTVGAVFQWTPGLRLTEALARAGGVGVGGDKDDVRVIRGSLQAPRVYSTSVRDIVDGDSYDVELHPGDVIYVTDHWIEDMGEVFGALAPVIALGFSISALAVAMSNSPQ